MADTLVARGEAALAAGDRDTARLSFEEAVGVEPRAEALDGLGRTLWWLGEGDAAIEQRERRPRSVAPGPRVPRGARDRGVNTAVVLASEQAL